MKKLLFAVAFTLTVASVTTAQKKGDVEFGLNVGLNSASVSDGENNTTDASIGFNVGASAEYYFSDAWGIKAKVIYDQKGWDNGFIENAPGDFYPTDFNLDYVTVPIMASWHFAPKRNWYLNFGIYAGFLVSATETAFDTNVKPAFNSNDFGLALGVGVKIPVSDKLKLSLEYEGQGGFSDIFKDNPYSAVQNSRSSFNIGVNFLMK